MARPEWLRCETCLWFERNADDNLHGCHHNSGMLEYFTRYENKKENLTNCFCSNWTCAKCFKSYDAWASRDYDTDEEIYVDHGKCREMRFGI